MGGRGPTGGDDRQIEGPGSGSEESQRPGGQRANRLVDETGLPWARREQKGRKGGL